MKNVDETAKALVTLLNNAETDFEKHRIEILMRDLIEPPKPEIIDEKHQKFNGKIYSATPQGRFLNNNSIHRAVYEYYVGKIPQGYVIHHLDRNPANNVIENLQCLTILEHQKIHHPKGTPFQNNKTREYVCIECGKKFTATDKGLQKFCSKECRVHHRMESLKVERICKYCGKVFRAVERNHSNFCCKKCQMSYMWENTTTRERKKFFEKICPVCGKKFVTSISRQKTCSRTCGRKLGEQNIIRPPKFRMKKVCPECGKVFEVFAKHKEKKFCSQKCSLKFANEVRLKNCKKNNF